MRGPKIVADSSIWIDHLNRTEARLTSLLRRRRILLHPMIIGEVALGSMRDRSKVLTELAILPEAAVASHAEVMEIIERLKLHNCGIGYVDAHLLASVLLTPDASLWTRDRRLAAQAKRLEVAAVL